MKSQSLKLSEIVTTAGTQIRARINVEIVDDYATAMTDGAKFPPVTVFHDGNQCILADGFHRVMAATRNGFKDILADVNKGTKSDALKFALGANGTHGLLRTNADKRRSVELALAEWPKVSNREIGRICAVSDPFVKEVRELLTVSSSTEPESRIGKDGKTRKVKPASPRVCESARVPKQKEEEESNPFEQPAPKSEKQAIKEAAQEITLKMLQVTFEESLRNYWVRADAKTKKDFLAWLKA